MGRGQRPAEAPASAEAEVGSPELCGGEVGELGDAVHGGGVHLLVPPRPPQVRLEHRKPVSVLPLIRIRLSEPPEEAREVGLRVQHQFVLVGLRNHLKDQRIIVDIGRRGGHHGGGERCSDLEEEEDEDESAIHCGGAGLSPWAFPFLDNLPSTPPSLSRADRLPPPTNIPNCVLSLLWFEPQLSRHVSHHLLEISML